MTHKKEPTDNWHDFGFQLRTYFNEWVRGMKGTTFDELMELLITDQIKQKIPPETRERFIEELPRIKEVDVLVGKLDDFDTALRGFKTANLHKAQNNVNRKEEDNELQQNSHRNSKSAIASRVLGHLCKLPGHIATKYTKRDQMATQTYHSNPLTKTSENATHRRTVANLSKAENDTKARSKIKYNLDYPS